MSAASSSLECRPLTQLAFKRLKSSHDFYESLVCPVCNDFFKPPIVNCRKGHSFCLVCIEQLEQTANKNYCSLCRNDIAKDCRNLVLEKQLSKVNLPCSWNGCRRRVSLSERSVHEKSCRHKPNPVCCVYAPGCSWQSNSCLLPKHLRQVHGIDPVGRAKTIKFLWPVPEPSLDKTRYRSLLISYPSNSTSSFLLEFVYLSKHFLCLFAVKSLDPEVLLKYRISIFNREEPANSLSFQDTTVYLADCPSAVTFPNCNTRRMLGVPLSLIQDYSFFNEADKSHYFSCHIEFYTLSDPDN